jgi:hypothetical protein
MRIGPYARARRILWEEHKEAGQYRLYWSDVEAAMHARYRLKKRSPPPEADKACDETANGNWRHMERVDIEPWFDTKEIGRPGDFPSVWATTASLEEDNRNRRILFLQQEQELRKAALSRA